MTNFLHTAKKRMSKAGKFLKMFGVVCARGLPTVDSNIIDQFVKSIHF